MKKILVILMMAGLFTFLLLACGKEEQSSEPPTINPVEYDIPIILGTRGAIRGKEIRYGQKDEHYRLIIVDFDETKIFQVNWICDYQFSIRFLGKSPVCWKPTGNQEAIEETMFSKKGVDKKWHLDLIIRRKARTRPRFNKYTYMVGILDSGKIYLDDPELIIIKPEL